jgi:hypothetical protein
MGLTYDFSHQTIASKRLLIYLLGTLSGALGTPRQQFGEWNNNESSTDGSVLRSCEINEAAD